MTTQTPIPSAGPQLENHVRLGLHAVLEGVAKSLTEGLAVVWAEKTAKAASHQEFEKAVAKALPVLLEKGFAQEFLQDKVAARRRRALMANLLSSVDLKDVPEGRFAAPVAVPEPALEVLTSEAGAKLLHVSRSHLNTLADKGELGMVQRTKGGHRRISKAALLAYKDQSKLRQRAGLEAMVEASQKIGLYADDLAGVPARPLR